MSVENLRVDDPTGKGWANLYMNNLTVYNDLRVKGRILDSDGDEVFGNDDSLTGIFSRDAPGQDPTFRVLTKPDLHPLLDRAGVLKSVPAPNNSFALAIVDEPPPTDLTQTFSELIYLTTDINGTVLEIPMYFLKTGQAIIFLMLYTSFFPGKFTTINFAPRDSFPEELTPYGQVEANHLNRLTDSGGVTIAEPGPYSLYSDGTIIVKRGNNESFNGYAWSSQEGFTFSYISK